jgi:hypothetical protein
MRGGKPFAQAREILTRDDIRKLHWVRVALQVHARVCASWDGLEH